MQAALSTFAGSAVQARVQRSSLAGRQLRGAVGNGARCRAFFKFGGGQKDKNGKERGYDSGVSIDAGANGQGPGLGLVDSVLNRAGTRLCFGSGGGEMGTLLQQYVKIVELFYTRTCYASLWWCSGAPGGGPLPCVCLLKPAQRGAAAAAPLRWPGPSTNPLPILHWSAPEYFTGEHRDDYQASDVQDYFMYMGMLASEARQRDGLLCRCAAARVQDGYAWWRRRSRAQALQGSLPCPAAWLPLWFSCTWLCSPLAAGHVRPLRGHACK